MDVPSCTRTHTNIRPTNIHNKWQNFGKLPRHTMKGKQELCAHKQNFWQPPQNLMNLKLFNQWIVMAGNNFKSSISFSVYRQAMHIQSHNRAHTQTRCTSVYCLSARVLLPLWLYTVVYLFFTDCILFDLIHNIRRFCAAHGCSFGN